MTEEVLRALNHFDKNHEWPSLWTAEYLCMAIRALEEVGSDYTDTRAARKIIEDSLLNDIGEECERRGENEPIMVDATHWRWAKPTWKFRGSEPEFVPDPHPTALCEGCYQEFSGKHPETEEEWF